MKVWWLPCLPDIRRSSISREASSRTFLKAPAPTRDAIAEPHAPSVLQETRLASYSPPGNKYGLCIKSHFSSRLSRPTWEHHDALFWSYVSTQQVASESPVRFPHSLLRRRVSIESDLVCLTETWWARPERHTPSMFQSRYQKLPGN